MSATTDQEVIHGTNPVIAIIAAIVAASVLVIITFTLFVNSSAYVTVKDILNNKLSSEDTGDYDTTSPVKAVDIQESIKTIEEQYENLDNNRDYGPDTVSEQNLGL
jgi:hypothetical protein